MHDESAMRYPTEATTDPLLADLSGPQREAVTHTDGPLLILAGPGSGKTRVVTRRAAHLSRTVTQAHHILAITFTNKAAREMQERIAALGAARGMAVHTFHAWCARMLREYHDRAGVPRNFTIFDREDRRKVIAEAVEACGLSTTNWPAARVEAVISRAKSKTQTAAAFAENASEWDQRTIARIYPVYEGLLADKGGLDFDDLLMRVAALLAQDADLRDELEDRYRYVLVDEFQDTNAAQYAIARLLAKKHSNICATGDPDQSIYGWRGADIENILSFERDFPAARIVRLEQNYRSTRRILEAADTLIGENVRRKAKTLWTQNEEGLTVRVVECENGEKEATMVAQDIAGLINSGAAPSDVAVFYRINSLSRVLEEAMIREGIAYQVARGVEFYNRKEIKDVLGYLRILVNPADEVALLRVINTPPRGIGAVTVQRLVQRARAVGRRILDLLSSGADLSELGRSAGKVQAFGTLLGELAPAVSLPPEAALEHVISHSGLRAFYRTADEMDSGPLANIDELVSAAAKFEAVSPDATILDWLEHTALLSDVDAVQSEGGLVTLMTLHAAKGLEFPVVYVIGLEDDILPFRRREDEAVDEEEERRLLFVGMTRAKERLTLSHARYRMLRGQEPRMASSPFLDELPDDRIEWVGMRGPSTRCRGGEDDERLPDDIDEWSVGTLVRHPLLGLGRIQSLQRGAKRTLVDVLFRDGSTRSWVLEFAKLERVDFDDIG